MNRKKQLAERARLKKILKEVESPTGKEWGKWWDKFVRAGKFHLAWTGAPTQDELIELFRESYFEGFKAGKRKLKG